MIPFWRATGYESCSVLGESSWTKFATPLIEKVDWILITLTGEVNAQQTRVHCMIDIPFNIKFRDWNRLQNVLKHYFVALLAGIPQNYYQGDGAVSWPWHLLDPRTSSLQTLMCMMWIIHVSKLQWQRWIYTWLSIIIKCVIEGGENVPLATMMRDIWCSSSYWIRARTPPWKVSQEISSLTTVFVALDIIVGIVSPWVTENGLVASLNARRM